MFVRQRTEGLWSLLFCFAITIIITLTKRSAFYECICIRFGEPFWNCVYFLSNSLFPPDLVMAGKWQQHSHYSFPCHQRLSPIGSHRPRLFASAWTASEFLDLLETLQVGESGSVGCIQSGKPAVDSVVALVRQWQCPHFPQLLHIGCFWCFRLCSLNL